eukprot:933369-Pelagomonas_calceolata.AAC.2
MLPISFVAGEKCVIEAVWGKGQEARGLWGLWAQRTSDRLQSMHQGLCGNSLQADRSWEGPTSSHGARYTDEGKEVSGSPTALQSLAGLYCGAVGGIRQAVLWVLQFGVSVAARIGLAIDEVARQQ